MAVLLQCIKHQHRGNRKQAKKREGIHLIGALNCFGLSSGCHQAGTQRASTSFALKIATAAGEPRNLIMAAAAGASPAFAATPAAKSVYP